MPGADEGGIRLLRLGPPHWFTPGPFSAGTIVGIAVIPVNASVGAIVFDLEIAPRSSGMSARERSSQSTLPTWCPERHINDQGWFCLGLASETTISDLASAGAWWDALHAFLSLQYVASQTGLWPEQHALSHGGAGHHHLAALKHAETARLADDYEAFFIGEPSLLGTLSSLLVSSGERLINGRAPCPCRKHKRGHPVVRRNCPRREIILSMLKEEKLRRAALETFWKAMEHNGASCCGSMLRCPLNRSQRNELPLRVA